MKGNEKVIGSKSQRGPKWNCFPTNSSTVDNSQQLWLMVQDPHKMNPEPEAMDRQLIGPLALAEEPYLILSTHKIICKSSSRGSDDFLWPTMTQSIVCGTQTFMQWKILPHKMEWIIWKKKKIKPVNILVWTWKYSILVETS